MTTFVIQQKILFCVTEGINPLIPQPRSGGFVNMQCVPLSQNGSGSLLLLGEEHQQQVVPLRQQPCFSEFALWGLKGRARVSFSGEATGHFARTQTNQLLPCRVDTSTMKLIWRILARRKGVSRQLSLPDFPKSAAASLAVPSPPTHSAALSFSGACHPSVKQKLTFYWTSAI